MYLPGARLLGWRRRRGYSLSFVHMEGVQVRVLVEVGREEVGDRETHGESQNEEATKNRLSIAHHGWHGDGMTYACRLEPCSEYAHNQTRAMRMRKMTCEVYLSTPNVGYSGSTSTVNETKSNKKVTEKLF